MSRAILEAAGVTRRFPGARRGGLRRRGDPILAVEDVSLAVPEGACFGLVGESGSGKTTLARMFAGLLPPSAGEIRCAGERVRTDSRSARRALWRRLQYVHQNPQSALNPRRRVGGILAEPLRSLLGIARAEREQRVARALERVGLEADAAVRYPHAFSGGQAQRIALARALILEPAVVVLDEPTSALDVRVQAHLLELLTELRRELGTAYLFISHDLALVAGFCEEVAVLQRGRVVEAGPCDELFARPRTEYTRRLIDAIPVPGLRRGVPLPLD